MRHVQTIVTCDCCGEERVFTGVRDQIPTHWSVLTVGDPRKDDGTEYVHRKAVICLDCRRRIDRMFNPDTAADAT